MYPQQSVTCHHAVGVVASGSSPAGEGEGVSSVSPWVPTKPFVALLGFLCIVCFVAWLTLGRAVTGSYYDTWWRAVRQELANANAPLWTLQRGRLPASFPNRPNSPSPASEGGARIAP